VQQERGHFAENIDNNERYRAVCAIAAAENAEDQPICAELEAKSPRSTKRNAPSF
jgi:hypothetical protein